MARKKKLEEGHINAERWLVSYADFMTLLFILFIILFSFSQIDAKKYQEVAASLAREFSGNSKISGGGNPVMTMPGVGPDDGKGYGDNGLTAEEKEQKALARLAEDIEEYAEQKGVSAYITQRYNERGLSISITGTVLYEDASATLTPPAKEFIKVIADHLKTLPNHIRVEGHTDNRPISTPEFPSNWELSAARSVNLVRYFIEELSFDPARLSVAGYSEYRPVASNNTVEGQNQNRRVEIIILKADDDFQ